MSSKLQIDKSESEGRLVCNHSVDEGVS